MPALRASRAPLPSYGIAGIAALGVFALYAATLAPTTSLWDTSEYLTAAYTLGLPHPPGNPFFVVLAHVFGMLPIAPTFAQRINLLAAASSAVAAGVWFLVAERVLSSWLAERWQRLVGGFLATVVSATAFTVWNQSVVNEKVYTVSLLFLAVVSWLTVLWCDDPDAQRADRLLVLIAFLLGLGYTNHPAGLLVAPAVGTAILARRWRVLARWRLVGAGAFAFVLGLSLFMFLPIRSGHFPALNEGEPTGCTTRFAWSCTLSADTKTRLAANINRDQYGKPALATRQAPFAAQVGMWWLYFKWQWLRDDNGQRAALQSLLAAVFLVLGLYGGMLHWRHDRRSFWFFAPLVGTVTVALIVYMNFKYGASQAPALGDTVPREVRDRDYFYVWSYSTWGVWAALGLVGLWATVAEVIGAVAAAPRRRAWVLAAPVLALALVPLVANWRAASHRGDTFMRDFAIDLLNSVEPYGVLIVNGDNDTFPLWYAQEVEGVRKDVTVAIPELMNTDWYIRTLLRRPAYDYDAAKGPAVFRGRDWAKPAGPILNLTIPEADAVPSYTVIDRPMLFKKDSIVATIDPSQLFIAQLGQNALLRGDWFFLKLIADSAPGRPVYVSRTAATYGEHLGLAPYFITQGLVRRLSLAPVHAGHDTVTVQGVGFVDVSRSAALWQSYRAPDSVVQRGRWVDKPSLNLPIAYLLAGQALANGLAETGQVERARVVVRQLNQLARASGFSVDAETAAKGAP